MTRDSSLESTLNALPDAVLRLGPDGAIRYLNTAARRLLGFAPDAATPFDGPDAQWLLIDHPNRAPLLEDLLARARQGGLMHTPPGTRLINARGMEVEIDGTCQALLEDADGTYDYVLQLRDITEEQEWRRQQPDLWDRDAVTALPGRRFMETRLDQALTNKRAGDLPMSFVWVRCHGIPTVYRELGEAAGDTLVRDLSALLRAHVRDTDLIARMDQVGFGLLLAYCPPDISGRIAAEVGTSLAGFRFEWRGRAYPIEAVLNQVDVPPFEGCLDELLAAAGARP